ncbi:hypothetical protein JNO54_08470 [Janibacter sp. YIM B02568]|uniref:hypothetical protein n=1 Tax=Janibacter endophyticus TaxID=2806261 RepID=UPI001952792A|nr:hypothetical protein [Janibacter endophyticus]MBM6546173.1 hypothetical protein [Janibacter endophyticus]
MSERYWWRYDGRQERPGGPQQSCDFPTQADAEAWFAQEWQTLADAGVTDVTLMREEAEVYGPMGLDPA